MSFVKKLKARKTILLFLVLVFSFSLSSITNAYVLKLCHIANGTTRTYYVGNDISSDGVYSITVADNQWNGISNRHVYLSQSPTRTNTTTWTYNGMTEIFKYEMGLNAGYIARTYSDVDATEHYMIESDCCINVSFNFSNSVPPPSGTLCLKTVMCHEMGHMIGFEHSQYTSKYDAIMAYGTDPGISTYNLKQDDINGYNAISW